MLLIPELNIDAVKKLGGNNPIVLFPLLCTLFRCSAIFSLAQDIFQDDFLRGNLSIRVVIEIIWIMIYL